MDFWIYFKWKNDKKYSANILHTNKNIGYIHEYTHVFGIADVPKKENIRKWEQ